MAEPGPVYEVSVGEARTSYGPCLSMAKIAFYGFSEGESRAIQIEQGLFDLFPEQPEYSVRRVRPGENLNVGPFGDKAEKHPRIQKVNGATLQVIDYRFIDSVGGCGARHPL